MPYKVILGIVILLIIFFVGTKTFDHFKPSSETKSMGEVLNKREGQLAIVPIERSLTDKQIEGATEGSVGKTKFSIPFVSTNNPYESQGSINYSDDTTGKTIVIGPALQLFNKNLYEDQGFKTDHEAYSKILLVTTDNLNSEAISPEEKTQLMILSLLKSSLVKQNNKLYSFSTDTIKGFQLGDPSEQDTITIKVFDKTYGRYIHTVTTSKLTQDEIDYILRSFKI